MSDLCNTETLLLAIGTKHFYITWVNLNTSQDKFLCLISKV